MDSWFRYLKHALRRESPSDPVSNQASIFTLRRNLSNLKPFLLAHWKKGLRGILLIVLTTLLAFPVPLITRFLIDRVIIDKKTAFLLGTVLLLAAFKLAEKTIRTFQEFFFRRFEEQVLLDIQNKLLDHTLSAPKSFFDSKDIGYLMSRLLEDVRGLRWFFSSTTVHLLSSVLRFSGGLVLLFVLKWQLALLVLGGLPLLALIAGFFAKKVRILSHHVMEQHGRVAQNMEESLASVPLIKAFATEKKTTARMMKNLRGAFHVHMEYTILETAANLLIDFFPEISRFLVLLAGAFWVINDQWTLGSLLAFQSYLSFVYGPAHFLSQSKINLQNALAALERVSALFDIVPERNIHSGRKVQHLQGDIEFRHVTFSYHREPVLDDVSFHVPAGRHVAVVGPSGVGKTTLLSLLLAFYQPREGTITFDGMDLKNLRLDQLRQRIGYVSQDPLLLSGTIQENLSYGNRGAGLGQLADAARIAGIYDFIQGLPDMWQERLGERGVNLSSGQKQRLALARVLVKNPDIYILDEPTSSLDHAVERSILDALPDVVRGKTLFMVTHRWAPIKRAHRVLLLNESRLLSFSTPQELRKNNRYFNNLIAES